MKIRDEADAAEAAYLRNAFLELLENKAWKQEIAPRFKTAFDDHREGCRARQQSPEQRAQHVEASYLAEELMGFAQKRIAELEEDLRGYSARNTV